jgi:hypothetical protein
MADSSSLGAAEGILKGIFGGGGVPGMSNSSSLASAFDSSYGLTNNAGLQVTGSGKATQENTADTAANAGVPSPIAGTIGTPQDNIIQFGILGLAALAIIALIFASRK